MIFRLVTSFCVALLLAPVFNAAAQNLFFTTNGNITFFSSAPMEDISAENKKVSSVLNADDGKIMFKVPMNRFDFPNDLMEEHYNEKYVETEKYPFAEFSGIIQGFSDLDMSKSGKKDVVVKGDLTLHGVTRSISERGTLTVSTGKIGAQCKMKIRLADYKIEIPTLVVQKIAEVVDVSIDLQYAPYKK